MKRQQSGIIANISFVSARRGKVDRTLSSVPFATAKSGVLGLTKNLAGELSLHSIRVSACVLSLDLKRMLKEHKNDRTVGR